MCGIHGLGRGRTAQDLRAPKTAGYEEVAADSTDWGETDRGRQRGGVARDRLDVIPRLLKLTETAGHRGRNRDGGGIGRGSSRWLLQCRCGPRDQQDTADQVGPDFHPVIPGRPGRAGPSPRTAAAGSVSAGQCVRWTRRNAGRPCPARRVACSCNWQC
jgi:hypothetical protein